MAEKNVSTEPQEKISTPRSPLEKQIARMKRSCSAKKGSITKRIEQLTRLVSEGGSRTKISALCNKLVEVHKATQELFEELTALFAEDTGLEEPVPEWIEEINIRVDTCEAEVKEYLDARKDDAPSSSQSYAESWIEEHSSPTRFSDMDSVCCVHVPEHRDLPDHYSQAQSTSHSAAEEPLNTTMKGSTMVENLAQKTINMAMQDADPPHLEIPSSGYTVSTSTHQYSDPSIEFGNIHAPLGSVVTSMPSTQYQSGFGGLRDLLNPEIAVKNLQFNPSMQDNLMNTRFPDLSSQEHRLYGLQNYDHLVYNNHFKNAGSEFGQQISAHRVVSSTATTMPSISTNHPNTQKLHQINLPRGDVRLRTSTIIPEVVSSQTCSSSGIQSYGNPAYNPQFINTSLRPNRQILPGQYAGIEASSRASTALRTAYTGNDTQRSCQFTLPTSVHPSTQAPQNQSTYTTSSYSGLHNPISAISASVPLQSEPSRNKVDSWIDDLDDHRVTHINAASNGMSGDVAMAWCIQQSLPRVIIPVYDGNPMHWVEFITKFRDLVHDQLYLNDSQRRIYLLQHLGGEAKRSVQGFVDDKDGYVRSLKRLKFMFGQRSRIAQATLSKVTRGKPINNDDFNGLVEFYYTISDCLVTLKMLNYASDLYSCDILRQAVRRLPNRLLNKWAEYCLSMRRRNQEPNLLHLESWVQERVMAQQDSYLPQNNLQQKLRSKDMHPGDEKVGRSMIGATQTTEICCLLCKEKHKLSKCPKYKEMAPNKRFEKVKELKLCYNCLNGKHNTSSCFSTHTCFSPGCNKKHHTTLHGHFVGEKKGEKGKEEKKSPHDSSKEERKAAFNGMVRTSAKQVHLQVVPVKLIAANGRSMMTHALLDTGSQSTLIKADVARKLKLTGKKSSISITTVKDKEEKMAVQLVSLEVASTNGEHCLKIESAYVVPSGKFNMPSQPLPSDHQDSSIYTHLDGIDLESVKADEISILIGANVPEAMIPLEVRRGANDQPLALLTKFGWTLFGSSTGDGVQHFVCNMVQVSEADQRMDSRLERFWRQEHFATVSEREVGHSREDIEAEETLKKGTKLVNGKYEIPLLWKDSTVSLPNNLPQAKKRFEFLLKRLRADAVLYEKYKENIMQYLEKGYARVMTDEEVQNTTSRTWYLPHHPVFNPNKPGKLRVVFDAAARVGEKGLNASLITGPDLLNSLVGVLLRFRTNAVAIMADVEAMFHQVKVNQVDADSLRFLWKDDIHSDDPPKTLQMLVHIFGAKDSPSCANYAIKSTARDNHQDFSAIAFESALKAFYADDLLKSVKTEEVAKAVAKELIELMQCGGFRLTKFVSNRKAVLESLPISEVTKIEFGMDAENLERTLGVTWEINQDVFTFQSHIKDALFTKRGILRTVSSIFDPLGFLGPYIIKAKIFLQELWRHDYAWDDEVKAESIQYWKLWLEGARKINLFKLQRCYCVDDQVSDIELHVFGDASESAYGAVAYLRFIFKDGERKSILVMSKSKLAPIKTVTLPRLELNAAVVAVRLYRMLIRELDLPIERSFFWTDSTLTLQYIRNRSQRFKVYVANRVTEILEVTDENQWNFVPGELNPADMVTRGLSDPSKLMQDNKFGTCWVTGPRFLSNDDSNLPEQPHIMQLNDEDSEIKRIKILAISQKIDLRIIDAERFSKWSRLRRAVAWATRFIHNSRKTYTKMKDNLLPQEIKGAVTILIKDVQQEVFADEFQILKSGGTLPAKNKLSSLCPLIDEREIIRVGGRLKKAPVPLEAKHQYVLPKYHHITKLIVREEHEKNGHIGREHVLANLRQFCWIINGRAAVRSVISKCFPCRIKRAKQNRPYMADLPEGRMAIGEAPFTNCGVDLFGPIYVKQGRKRLKRWGVIFTCLTIRCIHLEVVENADTDSFISTLRRFTNRRGKPKVMHSDNGTNFKGATRELKDLLDSLKQADIANYAAENGITWKFNPPYAPHMGGIWERLIRSVKEVMTGIMKDTVLTDFQLATLFTEVEMILNSRPLTHSSEDVQDLEALTPNHALIGEHRNWHAMGEYPEKFTSRKRWKQVQFMTNCFWKRWRREYLPLLTTRSTGREMLPNYNVGDLVLVSNTDLSRGKWPLGRITKVMPGNDGVVRVAEVRTKDGNYVRPIIKLFRLEENNVRQGEGDVAVTK